MMPMLTLNAYPLTTLDQRQSFGLDGIWFCSKEELFSSNLSIAGHLRKKLTEDLVTNHEVILCMNWWQSTTSKKCGSPVDILFPDDPDPASGHSDWARMQGARRQAPAQPSALRPPQCSVECSHLQSASRQVSSSSVNRR
jgi:hypothetical protein